MKKYLALEVWKFIEKYYEYYRKSNGLHPQPF